VNVVTGAGVQDTKRGAALELAAALDDLVDALAASSENRAAAGGADRLLRLGILAAEVEHAALHRRAIDPEGLGRACREVEQILLGCASTDSPRVVESPSRALAACRGPR
jgi:hypothetical protein